MMENMKIRKRIDEGGFKYWQVANLVGVTDTTLSKWMRFQLTGARLERVEEALLKLEEESQEV